MNPAALTALLHARFHQGPDPSQDGRHLFHVFEQLRTIVVRKRPQMCPVKSLPPQGRGVAFQQGVVRSMNRAGDAAQSRQDDVILQTVVSRVGDYVSDAGSGVPAIGLRSR